MQGSNPCLVLMSKQQWYRQCKFEAPTELGKKVETAWIPEKFAKVGKRIYIGEKRPNPEPIWTVTHVYARRTAEWVNAHAMDHKNQRKVSDI